MEINFQNIIGIITVCINLLIGAGAIITNIIISSRTIRANKDINRENAGKNRIIYGIEIQTITEGDTKSIKRINEMLNSGNYTILSSFQNMSNYSERVYTLGKVSP